MLALRDRLLALRAVPCDMAHERIPSGVDGMPLQAPRNQSGYARPGICAAALRDGNVGCSHTMARYVLGEAVERLPGDAKRAMHDELRRIEDAVSLLDHRRYEAECRRADALMSGSPGEVAAAQAEIAHLIIEHRSYGRQALTLRDACLRALDATLAE